MDRPRMERGCPGRLGDAAAGYGGGRPLDRADRPAEVDRVRRQPIRLPIIDRAKSTTVATARADRGQRYVTLRLGHLSPTADQLQVDTIYRVQ